MRAESTATRRRILDVTWKLMEKNVGRGVRMSDIAKEAGVSRQAVYLHFKSRAELLIATTRYVDEVKGVDARLAKTLNVESGREHLSAWIEFWGDHAPEIHGIARALMADLDTDDAAAAAWQDRMQAVRRGCKGVIEHLDRDGALAPAWTVATATDLLAAMLSVRQWEQLTIESGWSREEYVKRLDLQAFRTFVVER